MSCFRPGPLLVVMLVVCLVASACSASADSVEPVTFEPSVAFLVQAGQRVDAAESWRFEVFTEVASSTQTMGSRTVPYRRGETADGRSRTSFDLNGPAGLVIAMGGLDPESATATLITDGGTAFITTPFFIDLFTLGGAPVPAHVAWVSRLENGWGQIDLSQVDSELELLEQVSLFGGGSASELLSLLDMPCGVTDGGASEVRGVPTRIARAELAAGALLPLIQIEMESFGAGAPPSADEPVTIDVHVDGRGLVRRIEYSITFATDSGRSPDEFTGWQQVDFFDFDDELEIQLPDDAFDVTELYDELGEDETASRSTMTELNQEAADQFAECTAADAPVASGSEPVVSATPRPLDVVVETIVVGAGPFPPLAASGLIWVSNFDDATVSVIDPGEREVVSTIGVGRSPATPIASNSLVWVANHDDATVSVIDPAKRAVVSTVSVGRSPTVPLAAHDMVWVPNTRDATVSVIDPVELTVVDTIGVGTVPVTPLAADGLIWVPNRGDGTVSVIDPLERVVVDTIAVGNEPLTPAAAKDLVWVVNRGDGTMSVIDPAERVVVDTIDVGIGPDLPISANDLVWVVNRSDGTVSVIDPAKRLVVDIIDVGANPLPPLAALDRVWVPNQGDDTVSVIDPAERVVVDTIEVGPNPLTPAGGYDNIWVANLADGTVSVIGPDQPG